MAAIQEAKDVFLSSVKQLWIDGTHSDLTIKCGAREWKVHKAVVCSPSSVLSKESIEGVIHLKEDVPEYIDVLLWYLYTFDYDSDVTSALPIRLNIRMHRLGEYYDIPPLKILAETKLAGNAKEDWRTEGFANAVRSVFEEPQNSDEPLRKILLEISLEHLRDLYKEEFGQHFRHVVGTVPELGSQLCGALMKTADPPVGEAEKVRFRCPYCRHDFAGTLFDDEGFVEYACPNARCNGAMYGRHWNTTTR